MTGEIWLDGFQQIHNHRSGGGTFTGARKKWTGHTTEGLSKDPAGQAARHPYPPQIWVCPPSHPYRPRWRGQIIPLNRSGFALKHNPGDPETNKAGAIQVEIEGFSAAAGGWSRYDLDWLTDEVVGPMCEATGVDVATYVDTSRVSRLGWGTWAAYGGLLCHRNVPGNLHTDAPIDLAYISARLLTGGGSSSTTTGVLAMPAGAFHHTTGPRVGLKEILRITDGISPGQTPAGILQTRWQNVQNGQFTGWANIAGNLDQTAAARWIPGTLTVDVGQDGNPWVSAQVTGGSGVTKSYWFNEATGQWMGPANVN